MLLTFLSIQSQEILDNNSILSMVEMEFGDALIIDKIENSENTFDTSISVLGELKKKGVSQSILSAMIKSAKKEEETQGEVNLSNNLQYTFSCGAESYTVHLLKDKYYENLNGLILESVINSAITSAKFELKNKSTYVPSFINLIRDSKKNKNTISILGSAQNDYGATKDTHYKQSFDYSPIMTSDNDLFLVNNVEFNELEFRSLESKVQLVDYRNDKSNSHFYYKYVTIDGSKSKSKGEVFMNENYLVVTSEAVYGYQSPDVKSVILKNHMLISHLSQLLQLFSIARITLRELYKV